jgi:hypothetical protein
VCELMNPVATRSPRWGVSKADDRFVLSRGVLITRSKGGDPIVGTSRGAWEDGLVPF